MFEVYPKLEEKVPWISLGNFPTTVHKLNNFGKEIGVENFYIKRDDQSSDIYGGNKVRKLEFVLAEAKKKNASKLITLGAVGSNHVLATAIFGQKLGMKTIGILFDQPIAEYARRNMLLMHYHGAKLAKAPSISALPFTFIYRYLANAELLKGKVPYYIPAGGSSALGCLGYVNAAFELKKQVEEGQSPVPDYLFVPLGTMGTAAGIFLGLKLIEFPTKIVGVRVAEKWMCNAKKFASKVNRICSYLRRMDTSIPKIKISAKDAIILDEYFGKKYAQFTEEGIKAVLLMKSLEGIVLEGTYTGKTLAGAVDCIKKNNLQGKTILFWNTYNSVDLSHLTQSVNYKELPKALHKYFELPCQKLDLTAK